MATHSSTTPEVSSSRHAAAAPAAAPAAARSPLAWAVPPLAALRRPERAVRLTDAHPARVLRAHYDLRAPALGRGAGATVRRARRRADGRPVAVKALAKPAALGLWGRTRRRRAGARRCGAASPRDAAAAPRWHVPRAPRLEEADVLASLRDCAGVVRLLDVYESHQEVQLVLEYCAGGDLFECIERRKRRRPEPKSGGAGNFTELETALAASTLLGVLETLHSRNIVHRDVKPENILILNEGNTMTQLGAVKLTDFGLARVLHQDDASSAAVDEELSMHKRNRAYSRVGSDYYAAPEILLSAGYAGYDTPVDVYSLGVTLCVLLCGAPPAPTSFFRSEEADLTDADASDADTSAPARRRAGPTARFPSASHISAAARDLLAKMIHPDPGERITASEALQHDWIRTHVASQPSLSSKSDTTFVETRSPLYIGPTVADIPPSDSPHVEHVEPTPAVSSASTSFTPVDVCHQLAPLADERRHCGRQHGPHSRPLGGDAALEPPRKRSRSSDTRESRSKQTPAEKKRCFGSRVAPNLQMTPQIHAKSRISQRFNAHTPVIGPLMLQPSESPARSTGSDHGVFQTPLSKGGRRVR